jgi:hypothetical protein
MVTNRYMMAGAVVAGLALAYVVYRSGAAVVDVVGDAAQAINPLNNDNVINRGFTNLYQGVTGSTGSLGTDAYDIVHSGVFDPTSENNIVYRNLEPATKVTLENTVGKAMYDIEQWYKNLGK